MKSSDVIKSLEVIAAAVIATMVVSSPAHAETNWYCKGDECVGRTEDRVGTYNNPIPDVYNGDLSGLHQGMYCVNGQWHEGFLRRGERSPVIKPSCGDAVYQMPH
jgi:hypothetical protein